MNRLLRPEFLASGAAGLCFVATLAGLGLLEEASALDHSLGLGIVALASASTACLVFWLAFLLARGRRALSGQTSLRIAAERDAFRATRRDSLTGLPNRIAFSETIAHSLDQAWAGGKTCSVLFLDLDGFKPVNDTHGHAAGDDLLVQIASRLQKHVPESGWVARLGGDEFGILLKHGTAEDVMPAAEEILREIDRPFQVGPETLYLGASLGAVTFSGTGDRAEDLIHAADLAMYDAKRSGLIRNRVVLNPASASAPLPAHAGRAAIRAA